MPELIEIEYYRSLAASVVGRRVARVAAPDAWFLKRGLTAATARRAVTGQTVTAARRIGKLLLLDTTGPTLGLRFGMTGRLLVDGRAALERLEYGSARQVRAWDRFALRFDGGGSLVMRDPRRLGGVELEPDEERLGVEASLVGRAELAALLAATTAPVKARLMDQSRIAGLGNLLTDEVLWRSGIDPARPGRSLTAAEVRRLHRYLVGTVHQLLERGGSHTGDLQVARVRGGLCPRDGAPLLRRRVGGRTTYSCPRHQH